jgi:hypothetical protein
MDYLKQLTNLKIGNEKLNTHNIAIERVGENTNKNYIFKMIE